MLYASRSKATVLIVEDDALFRELLTQLLLTGGFDVIALPTGEQALLALCRHGDQIDWLVSKIRLPGLLCGWVLADEYREHHPDRPVVLIPPHFEPAEMSSDRVVFVPPGAPMRVLEVLQALKNPEPTRVLPLPEAGAA
ncbi:response regulator [Microvirga pakistanensis]|uniref:response regulator n=1 Tax=Microvirga pakistanensis TaxID=1682650 RepID=UPI0010692344|nr:response regulator [Microvirga pakistanensis]